MQIRPDRSRALFGVLEQLGFEAAGLTEETRFREDLEVDSTELVEISVAVEQRLGVTVDPAAFSALTTVGELLVLIESSDVPM